MPNRPLQWPTVARTFIAVVVLMCLLAMCGCTDSDSRIDQIKADAVAQMQTKADEVAAEKARVAAEVRRAERDATLAISRLGADADAQAAALKAAAEDKAEGATIALTSFTAKRAADVEAIRRAADASIAKIEAQQVGLQNALGLVQSPAIASALSALPGGSLVSAGIVGLLGYGLRSRAAKQTDSAWDEATHKAMLLMATPPGAAK